MKYYLITGASRGLGEALALALAGEQTTLVTCSRRGLTDDQQLALVEKGAKVIDLKADLSKPSEISQTAERLMAAVDTSQATQIILFNNAGGVEPIAPFYKAEDEAVMANIALNFTAPMILSSQFGKAFSKLSYDRRIVTVSSGAGKRPIFGWNSYCASKAAVDMMTRVIGLEEGETGIQAISFGPGIMDTEMQGTIRAQDVSDFKDVVEFRGFKENGSLLPVQTVANALVKLIDQTLENGALVSVKDFI